MKRNTVLPSILFVTLLSTLMSGCGTVRNLVDRDDSAKSSESNNKELVKGITYPPEITDNAADRAVETSPEDTISFDEWRKQREEALEAAQPES